jgi:beta-lactamase superfamily II metal-dependent hydrolase
MVCTHPDDDHINGLFGVLEQIHVETLLLHRPGDFGHSSDDVKAGKVDELIALARREGTKVITDAFAGDTFFSGAVMVGGPTREYYATLLGEQVHSAGGALAAAGHFLARAAHALKRALTPRWTDPGEGYLSDNGGTTPRNNSSIILDVQVEGYRALLTGDAGVPALQMAGAALEAAGRSATYPDFFDNPHHGSRHNLNSETLDLLVGPMVENESERTAVASVGAKADDFPRPEVANALKRRGHAVAATRGTTIRWSRNAPSRSGWSAIDPLPWLEVD